MRSPSHREICMGTGIRSTSTVAYYLKKMQALGMIHHSPRRFRSITLYGHPALTPLQGRIVPIIMAIENLRQEFVLANADAARILEVEELLKKVGRDG